jgi:hypothetical protein
MRCGLLPMLTLLCLMGCAKRIPHELDSVKAADVKKVTLQGFSVANADNKVEFTDPKEVASFLHAFQNRISPPDSEVADKVNSMTFTLSSGQEITIGLGQTSILMELGPEMEAVVRPHFKKD